jgi:hypothetical protein
MSDIDTVTCSGTATSPGRARRRALAWQVSLTAVPSFAGWAGCRRRLPPGRPRAGTATSGPAKPGTSSRSELGWRHELAGGRWTGHRRGIPAGEPLRGADQLPQTRLRLGPHPAGRQARGRDLVRARRLRPQPDQDQRPDDLKQPETEDQKRPPRRPRTSSPARRLFQVEVISPRSGELAGSDDFPGVPAWRPYAGKTGWLSASGRCHARRQ